MNDLNCTFTEEEGLLFLAEKNIPKAQAKLNSFYRNKKLKTKPQIKALVEDLNMFFFNVSYSGSGQDREYTHEGKKETPSKRVTGNSTNGKKETEDDEIIREHFFNQLSKRINHREKGWAETINIWGRDWINELEVSDSEWEVYEKKLQEAFSNQSEITDEVIKQMLFNIKDNVKKNYRSLAIKSIERLEKENRIETDLEFYQALAKGSYIASAVERMAEEKGETANYHNELNEDKHAEIVAGVNEFLEPYEMNYERFKVVSAFPQFAVNNEREIVKMANKWLKGEHSIDYIYSRIRIHVKDAKIRKNISKKEVKAAFINRIIKNTDARMSRKDYKDTHKFQVAFYRLSMFMLLDLKKVKGLKEAIEKEKLMIKENVAACQYEYALKYGEKIEEPEVYGFGEVALDRLERMNKLPFDVSKLFEPVEKNVELVEVKEKVNPNLIDIAAIGLEDDVEYEEPKEAKSFNDIHKELIEKLNGNKKEKTALNEKLMPKSDDVNFSWGSNITDLSLRGIEKWAK
ncbi:hypothetical protein R0K17_09555 [Planococcus sp. SIMBA_143]